MKHTDRRLAIVLELEMKGWQRAADLAATFGVSTRTIYRDMDALEEAGLPIVAVPGKGYCLYEGYFLPPLTLTSDEAVLLLLGTDSLAEQLGVAYQAAARAVRAKVEAILPERLRGEVTTLQNSLRFVPVNAFDDPAEQQGLQVLRQALAEQHSVRFHYAGPAGEDDAVLHTVNPYGLMHVGGAWHLVGYHHERQSVRHFRLRSLEALEVLAETFERPQGYTLPGRGRRAARRGRARAVRRRGGALGPRSALGLHHRVGESGRWAAGDAQSAARDRGAAVATELGRPRPRARTRLAPAPACPRSLNHRCALSDRTDVASVDKQPGHYARWRSLS